MKKLILFVALLACLSVEAQTPLIIDDFRTGDLSLSETAVADNVNKSIRFQKGLSIYIC